ncbi:MAG TPA: LON peptidase substrate-binding domain-containing protein, partial [Anaerolineales bacterium]|nr:LON peptidase substrate-binding domain-containing protein [Anaerolineales bacterium]
WYNGRMFELPLFPLHTVLFPGMPIRLNIFEKRYKEMIGQCMESGSAFGVVLIREGVEACGPLARPYPIGCTAEIKEVEALRRGQTRVLAVGRERFRIFSLSHQRPYLVGNVDWFPLSCEDRVALTPASEQLGRMIRRYGEALECSGLARNELGPLPHDPVELAYLAAVLLQAPLQEKQSLLASEHAPQLVMRMNRSYQRELSLLQAVGAHHLVESPSGLPLN